MDPRQCQLALGSNIGDRTATIRAAIAAIDRLENARVIAQSPIIETEAVTVEGAAPQRAYRNAAITIETTLDPAALLERLQEIERSLGRRRAEGVRWAPRTIDIDILLDGDLIMDEPGLTIPHPRMHERRFVLGPLCAISPDAVHPALRRSVRQLLSALDRPNPGVKPAAIVMLALLSALFTPGFAQTGLAQAPPADQPADPPAELLRLDPGEVFRSITDAYRAGPIAERVTVTAVSEHRQREQTATVFVDAPGKSALLELGPLRALARNGELRVTHKRRGDRYAIFPAGGRSIAAIVADSLPPIPLPELSLAFDDPADPVHLTPFPGIIEWTDAMHAPGATKLVLIGAGPGTRVTYVVNTETWRLIAGVLTTPDSGLHIEMTFEGIDPGDPAEWAIGTQGKSPVPTLAQLQPGDTDIGAGAPAPPMVFFTLGSKPWRLEADHEGPIALLFFREISPAVLAARDAITTAVGAGDQPFDVQPVLVTSRLVGIDLFERLGRTVHAYGDHVLWTASPEATIDRFTTGPACAVFLDADATVRAVVEIGKGVSRADEARQMNEAVAELTAGK